MGDLFGDTSDIENAIRGGSSQAQGAINKGVQDANTEYQPYSDAGKNAVQSFQDLLNSIQSGDFSKNYTESPYAKYLTNKSLNAMNNAASAAGLLGSGANQTQNAEVAEGIASKDMNEYIRTLMGGYSDLTHTGESAAEGRSRNDMTGGEDIASIITNAVNSAAQAHQAGQQGKGSTLGGIGSIIGGIIGLPQNK